MENKIIINGKEYKTIFEYFEALNSDISEQCTLLKSADSLLEKEFYVKSCEIKLQLKQKKLLGEN